MEDETLLPEPVLPPWDLSLFRLDDDGHEDVRVSTEPQMEFGHTAQDAVDSVYPSPGITHLGLDLASSHERLMLRDSTTQGNINIDLAPTDCTFHFNSEVNAYVQGLIDGSLNCTTNSMDYNVGGMNYNVNMELDVPEPNIEVATVPKRQKKLSGGYPCPVTGCNDVFDRTCDLRKHHQRKHLPEAARPLGCDFCDKRFCDRKDLKRHISNRHKNGTALLPQPQQPSGVTDVAPTTTFKRRRLRSPLRSSMPTRVAIRIHLPNIGYPEPTKATVQEAANIADDQLSLKLAGLQIHEIQRVYRSYHRRTPVALQQLGSAYDPYEMVAVQGPVLCLTSKLLALQFSSDFNPDSTFKFRSIRVSKQRMKFRQAVKQTLEANPRIVKVVSLTTQQNGLMIHNLLSEHLPSFISVLHRRANIAELNHGLQIQPQLVFSIDNISVSRRSRHIDQTGTSQRGIARAIEATWRVLRELFTRCMESTRKLARKVFTYRWYISRTLQNFAPNPANRSRILNLKTCLRETAKLGVHPFAKEEVRVGFSSEFQNLAAHLFWDLENRTKSESELKALLTVVDARIHRVFSKDLYQRVVEQPNLVSLLVGDPGQDYTNELPVILP